MFGLRRKPKTKRGIIEAGFRREIARIPQIPISFEVGNISAGTGKVKTRICATIFIDKHPLNVNIELFFEQITGNMHLSINDKEAVESNIFEESVRECCKQAGYQLEYEVMRK